MLEVVEKEVEKKIVKSSFIVSATCDKCQKKISGSGYYFYKIMMIDEKENDFDQTEICPSCFADYLKKNADSFGYYDSVEIRKLMTGRCYDDEC